MATGLKQAAAVAGLLGGKGAPGAGCTTARAPLLCSEQRRESISSELVDDERGPEQEAATRGFAVVVVWNGSEVAVVRGIVLRTLGRRKYASVTVCVFFFQNISAVT